MNGRMGLWMEGCKVSHEDVIGKSLNFEANNDTNERNSPTVIHFECITATITII
jgi:hypothetical protein